MWRLKQFMPKDQTSLEGKSVEVGSLKLQVRSVIAQGGFSSVYLARDAQTGKIFALKHIICNDAESLDLVRKEVSVMKSLRGHPNVVTLHAQAVFDAGRTKDCFLVMDYCEKTLVNILDNRGAGYFDEKQLLLIFRDVCNAVYGMHSQSPPIAHRDLKAENLLMGSDGFWKLCDFGSTSTNHRRFERAEEMGLEEDIIRKHTTPAYRAPEMWDLFRRELISEKVDIWALGCLLYRMAYLKSAFDGESKLQILNGNYRIPEAPRYSNAVVDLIKDMLVASPELRPDIMQIWRRVNESLPSDCRKSSPDKAAGAVAAAPKFDSSPDATTTRVAPSRSPPPPPGERQHQKEPTSGAGSFWSSQHAKEAKYDPETPLPSSTVNENASSGPAWSARFSSEEESRKSSQNARPAQSGGLKKAQDTNEQDKEARHSLSPPTPATRAVLSNDATFNTFVADFDTPGRPLQEEVDKLKKQLNQALGEKAEYMGKYEKLMAICRSQRLELQELKAALAAADGNSSSSKEPTKPPMQGMSRRTNPVAWRSSEQQQQKDTQNGSIWELQEGLPTSSSAAGNTKPSQGDSWQAFGGGGEASRISSQQQQSSAVTSNSNGRRQHARAASMSGGEGSWGFIQESVVGGSTSFRASEASSKNQKPAGWAGF